MKDVGKIRAPITNAAGKVIAEWQFQWPLTKASHRCVVKIFTNYDGAHFTAFPMKPDGNAQGTPFRQDLEVFHPITDTDINRLKERVEAAYQSFYAIQSEGVFSDWIELVVTPGGWGRDGQGVAVERKSMKKVVLPNGSEYAVTSTEANPFPKPKPAGVKDDVKFGGREQKYEYAYIPATEENKAKLEELFGAIATLRERLFVFIRDAGRAGALGSHRNLLAAPAEEDATE